MKIQKFQSILMKHEINWYSHRVAVVTNSGLLVESWHNMHLIDMD